MLFANLSDDEVINICKFLTVQCLGEFSACSSSIYRCCQQDNLWSESLRRTFPSLIPFSKSKLLSDDDSEWYRNLKKFSRQRNSFMNGSFPIRSSKLKMKNFSDRSYILSSVGELQTFRSRLLHRSVTDQAGVSYIFGGASTIPNFTAGSFRDVWKIVVNENTQQINFSRIIIDASGKVSLFFFPFIDPDHSIMYLDSDRMIHSLLVSASLTHFSVKTLRLFLLIVIFIHRSILIDSNNNS